MCWLLLLLSGVSPLLLLPPLHRKRAPRVYLSCYSDQLTVLLRLLTFHRLRENYLVPATSPVISFPAIFHLFLLHQFQISVRKRKEKRYGSRGKIVFEVRLIRLIHLSSLL